MREFEAIIDDAFTKGLRPERRVPRGTQVLAECFGFRIGKYSIEGAGYLTNPIPATVDMFYSWPFPQFIKGERYKFLVVRDDVNMEDVVYLVSADYSMATEIFAIDELTFGKGTLMEVADFAEYAFMTNGVIMIYWDTTISDWHEVVVSPTIPMMRTVCNFKGQMIGGCVLSDWHGCDETFVVWSKIGEADFTPGRRNEAGFRRDPFGGEIYHVRRFGNYAIIYSSKGVTKMIPVSQPVPTFGFEELHDVGLINRGAVAGNLEEHLFVDVDHYVWKLNKDGLEKIGYQEFVGGLEYSDILVHHDSNKKDFYISAADALLTTLAPTTPAPFTTAAPTTLPTTSAPTTAAPTTAAPTTHLPPTTTATTAAPTTLATTSPPTTLAPTTVPTTAAPTTLATTTPPTTPAPTSAPPTTAAPTTTATTGPPPTTAPPTTSAPTTAGPTTLVPTTDPFWDMEFFVCGDGAAANAGSPSGTWETGDDANSGASRATAWKTIQKAADTMTAGESVLVAAGMYNEFVSAANSGTPGDPITFQGDQSATGANPTIINPSTAITSGWVAATNDGLSGTGTYRQAFGYEPFEVTVDGKHIPRITTARMTSGAGFTYLAKAADAVYDLTGRLAGAIIGWWDGLECMFGYKDGYTYIRFRNGNNPNSETIRIAENDGVEISPKKPAFLIDGEDYITFKKFKCQGAYWGIGISNGSNNIIEDNYVLDGIVGIGIEATDSASNTIRNNTVTLNYYGYSDPGGWEHGTDPTGVHGIRCSIYARHKDLFRDLPYRIKLGSTGDYNKVYGNTVHHGIVGIIIYGGVGNPAQYTEIYDNHIYNMSSIGVGVSDGHTQTEIYDNLIEDCDLSFRWLHFHASGETDRTVFIYRNKLWQEEGVGKHVHVHWNRSSPSSHDPTIWMYNNSFSGGAYGIYNADWSGGSCLPNVHLINNVVSTECYFYAQECWYNDANALGSFDNNWVYEHAACKRSDSGLFGTGNIISAVYMWDPVEDPDFDNPAVATRYAGKFLATIVSVGGDLQLTLGANEAYAFFIGATIYDDDGYSATVVSRDAHNKITISGVDRAQFTATDTVTVINYTGSAPDIGAVEYTP